MTSIEDIENRCLPISKLKKYETEWVIKVLVIRRGLTKEYKNENGEGIRWQLIFVDEEGTKIQTTLFNQDVHTWNKYFELTQSYYIINGKLNGTKPNYLSVHKDLELAFTNSTEVIEDKRQFKTQQFSNGFITFDEAEKITDRSFFDVVCILIKVKTLNGEGRSIRREVIVTNEMYDRKTMTLWGDFAEIDGELLESLECDKLVLAFCDVKCSVYQGDYVLSTTPISSLIINPAFQKADDLKQWHQNMKAQNIDITLMPSNQMQTARQVKISDILNGSLTILKDMYYKFNAKVTAIDNNNDPWYHACKKCYRRVNVIKSTVTCAYCRSEDIGYEERYRLKIEVTAENQHLAITLFEAAQYFLGCDVKEYVRSTSEKKEESLYYRRLVLSKGKEFSILVKIDRHFAKVESNMNVIAVEIHEVDKKLAADESKVETSITKTRIQRAKKVNDKSIQQHQIGEKMQVTSTVIDDVRPKTTNVESQIPTSIIRQRSKRTRKEKYGTVIDKRNKKVAGIHDVQKHKSPHESDDDTPIIHLRRRTPKAREENVETLPMKQKIKVEKN